MTGPKEEDFETTICDWLLAHGGYVPNEAAGSEKPRHFDPERGIDTAELFAFIGQSQPETWHELVKRYGNTVETAQKQFANRVAKVLDQRGTIETLRHGVDDLGVNIKLAYFKPATTLNPETIRLYNTNRLTVTRQLAYQPNSNKTLDLCLMVNGIPVITAELKTHLTGQTADDARTQYETNRDPKNTTLANRAIAHFAVDTQVAWMTTRLDGTSTRWFHYNQGRNNGAGNPDNPPTDGNPGGHRTAYLWQQIWAKEPLLDILSRFVHTEPTAKGRRRHGATIFPRYHQWDAVTRLAQHTQQHGAGHNYLIEHSAGSGKSNTIAWLAHRLSTLHDNTNTKIFDKTIIITDRKVLDRQLQNTVSQFEKTAGVVQKIDEDSQQLADALTGEQARIIITTIQKFPFILDKIGHLPQRSYAIIADEAHSSTSGEISKDMKLVLSKTTDEETLAAEEQTETSNADTQTDPVQDKLAAEMDARGKQQNLSFFAFTATPKAKTLELFGNPPTPESGGKHQPFHLYSMRQAIEEGYIHDVLNNYTTYETFWNIEKRVADDPEYNPAKAKAAIAKYVNLHPHNLAQKADIIINHYRLRVAHQIGGQAKAMVVTASRLHALRYGLALREYCNTHGIGDVGILVAFSGTLNDNGVEYTETKINGFGESQTPAQFDTDNYHIMVVAEKYQTGFDQPKLHTMYVDKPLSGLTAVQTLSRLNRTHRDKTSTFVLDFRNKAEDIQTAFSPWYVQTETAPTDPNLMYDTHHQMTQYDLLQPDEVDAFVAVLMQDPTASDQIHARLDAAIARFWNDDLYDDDEREGFRDASKKFTSAYRYLAQIVPFSDIKLEQDYLFCKTLAPFIRKPNEPAPEIDGKVNLTHLATRLIDDEVSISLPDDKGELDGPAEMFGRPGVPDAETLSEIIKLLNERYGTNFDPSDRLFFDGLVEKMADKPEVQQAALANDEANFSLAMRDEFQNAVLDQFDTANDITKNFLDNEDFKADVMAVYVPLLQTKAKVAAQQHCPIGQLLDAGEGSWLEYKSTFGVEADTGNPHKGVETAAIKSVAAFLNAWDGGTVLLGVAEDEKGKGVPFGIAGDYAQYQKDGKDDADMFLLAFNDKLKQALGAAAVSNVTTEILTVDGKDLCRVHVRPCGFPVDAKVVVIDKTGQHRKQTNFYARINNATHKFVDENEKQKYIHQRWPNREAN